MKVFRFYTEDSLRYREVVKEEFGRFFDGFTIYRAEGMWKGSAEMALVVELVTEEEDSHQLAGLRGNLMLIADRVKARNNQQTVMVTEQDIHMVML